MSWIAPTFRTRSQAVPLLVLGAAVVATLLVLAHAHRPAHAQSVQGGVPVADLPLRELPVATSGHSSSS